jgi:hypothetical protein
MQDSRLQDTEAHQSDPQMLPREFQALPATLDGCIVRALETTQERVLFRTLMDTGMVLSGR